MTKVNIEKMKRNTANIPTVLKSLNTWVGFCANEEGEIVKKPLSLVDYRGVGTKDTDRLVSFDKAVEALNEEKVVALGVGLTADCDVTCIDIDCHDIEKLEKFEELNKLLLSQFNSYAETSISGKGTHIFIRAKKPEGYKHVDRYGIVEVYDSARFMIVTGDIIGSNQEVVDCQDELNKLCETHLPKLQNENIEFIDQGIYEVSNDDVLEKIKSFKKGKLFLEGNWEEVEKWDKDSRCSIKAYDSQSAADFAFISQILYVNGNNPAQAEEIFKTSKMYRGNKKSTGYVRHQVTQASLRITKVYDWKKVSKEKVEEVVDMEEIILKTREEEFMNSIKIKGLHCFTSKELNKYMTKYIQNFGLDYKNVIDTRLGDYNNSDSGRRFYYINKENLRYIDSSKEWLKWTGKYWSRVYDMDLLEFAEKVFTNLKHEAYNLAISSLNELDSLVKENAEFEAEELFKYTATSRNKRNCLEIIEFSKSHFIREFGDITIEEKNALNLSNGIYDFDKMEFVEHSKKYYQTKISKVEYNQELDCPLWEKTISRLVPSEEVRHYLQKALGYTISGKCNEKALFILQGSGNNGKTLFINTILKILSDYAVIVSPQTVMQNYANKNNGPRPDLLRLRDKRFATVSETEENDKLNEGLIKSLTGGGYISCRGLHKENVEFPSRFKLWFDTNYKPRVTGTDIAIWSRLKIIPFTTQIQKEEMDRELGSKLEKELSGILNWCIEGYKLYVEEGLSEPDEMKLVVEEFAEDMSAMDQWWKECVQLIPPDKIFKNHKCFSSKELYLSYKNWCDFNGEYKWTQRKFTQEMNKKEACKFIKKVNGFVRYLAIQLNELGEHCAEKEGHLALEFATKYNKIVNAQFTQLAKLEKEIKNYEKGKENNVIPITTSTSNKNVSFGGK
ncbi:P4 family phage/plasmid primase-like protein [Natranaerovirga pectinivora]|uniref:P4 family phage/plasmid primase-like protein n=1 Tax=Natranaerovirga pectinivora TaxID=682400 RepID=A0A4R3MPX7_9FIRM|nr:phage/plasmid primase, P4 family [Natranaerovirga pectinivora]TCT15679.1 P4 family phage/plasmid primase-like protein [Natranaerovirga pectinivora]